VIDPKVVIRCVATMEGLEAGLLPQHLSCCLYSSPERTDKTLVLEKAIRFLLH